MKKIFVILLIIFIFLGGCEESNGGCQEVGTSPSPGNIWGKITITNTTTNNLTIVFDIPMVIGDEWWYIPRYVSEQYILDKYLSSAEQYVNLEPSEEVGINEPPLYVKRLLNGWRINNGYYDTWNYISNITISNYVSLIYVWGTNGYDLVREAKKDRSLLDFYDSIFITVEHNSFNYRITNKLSKLASISFNDNDDEHYFIRDGGRVGTSFEKTDDIIIKIEISDSIFTDPFWGTTNE